MAVLLVIFLESSQTCVIMHSCCKNSSFSFRRNVGASRKASISKVYARDLRIALQQILYALMSYILSVFILANQKLAR